MNITDVVGQIDNLEKEINELKEKRKILCTHDNVLKRGGGMWHEYPNYGHYPYWCKCLDCGLTAGDDGDYKEIQTYHMLNKRVTKNESD